MKRLFYLIIILFLFVCCGPKQEEVERIMDGGAEVVMNHIEPYVIDGEPKILKAEREVLIDFESEMIAKLGISDIRGFDVDSEGNIFVSVNKGEACGGRFRH